MQNCLRYIGLKNESLKVLDLLCDMCLWDGFLKTEDGYVAISAKRIKGCLGINDDELRNAVHELVNVKKIVERKKDSFDIHGTEYTFYCYRPVKGIIDKCKVEDINMDNISYLFKKNEDLDNEKRKDFLSKKEESNQNIINNVLPMFYSATTLEDMQSSFDTIVLI